jgi:hypothetical protein
LEDIASLLGNEIAKPPGNKSRSEKKLSHRE